MLAVLAVASCATALAQSPLAIAQRNPQTRPQVAPEDPRIAEARRAYDEGRRLYDARSYADALTRFERAYELQSHADVLIPIANCHEALQGYRDAVGALERYLRDSPPTASERAAVEARLPALRARIAAAPTPAAAVPVAPTTQAPDSPPATTDAASAATTPVAEQPANADADGAATSPVMEPSLPPPRATSPVVWVCAGLAGAGVAAGSVLGFLALGEHATFNTAPSREVKDRGETFALLADLSFATAVLSGFVGTVVFLSDRAEDNRETALAASPGRRRFASRALRPRWIVTPTGVAGTW